MLTAAHRLRTTDCIVAAIGLDLGYRSESAFGAAFRRVFGVTPSEYRRSTPG
jgi:AraC-like DNA-binding protein